MHEHPIAHAKRVLVSAAVRNGGDDARRLVSQDARRLASDIPRQDVARANARRHGAHQHFTRLQLWNRTLLDSNVVDVVEYDRAHGFGNAHGSITAFMPFPASSAAKTPAMSSKLAVCEVKRNSGSVRLATRS